MPTSPRSVNTIARKPLRGRASAFAEDDESCVDLTGGSHSDHNYTQSEKSKSIESQRSWVERSSSAWQRQAWWPTEVLQLVVSLAVAVAIVILLLQYDGTPVSDWPLEITINALVSVMTAFAAIFVATPLNSCVGQIRWNRFQSKQRLCDFRSIGQAKSPIGALSLVLTLTGGPFAIFGASLVLLNLAVGPFVQQMIETEYRLQTQTVAGRIPVLKTYLGSQAANTTRPSAVSFPLRGAVYQGLYTNESTEFNVTVDCPDGSSCRWSNYTTIQFCSSCIDLGGNMSGVSDASQIFNGTDAGLEGDSAMRGELALTNSESNSTQFVSLTKPVGNGFPFDYNAPLAVLTLALMGRSNGSQVKPTTAACQISYCSQQYNAEYVAGKIIEIPDGAPQLQFDENGDQPTSSGILHVSESAVSKLQEWLSQIFDFSSEETEDDNGARANEDIGHMVAVQNAFFDTNNRFNISDLMDNIASSMSVAIRMHADPKDYIDGLVEEYTWFIRIRWAWLALPVAFYTLVSLLLLSCMIQTRRLRAGLWKDNDLAIVFHGLNQETRKGKGALVHSDEMNGMAQSMSVKMMPSEGGWFLASEGSDHGLEAHRQESAGEEPVQDEFDREPGYKALPRINTHVASSSLSLELNDRHSPVSPE